VTARRIVALAAMAALLAAAALGWRAPQVLVLASEGFPSPTWPASGDFAPVAGADLPDPPAVPLPGDAALARLVDSGGRALLVDQGGVLVAEAYGDGLNRSTRLNSYSLVKSLVGALALKAVAEGRIASLDTGLDTLLGPAAPPVTLREALTMTSGLVMPDEPPKTGTAPLDDASFSPFGPLARLHAYGIQAVMADLRVDPALRGSFHYQSANTGLVGLAVEQAWGEPLPEILSRHIWRPAGAQDADWRLAPSGGGVSAYCCLYARPLDWLKVGRFLLDNGTASEPFLPSGLWREFLLPDLDPQARHGGAYALHIRHDILDRAGAPAQGPFAYMMGHDGQTVYLFPGQDAVVVRFGARPQLLHTTLYELLDRPVQ
jgi:CubicO group peptidase (beta-lactamase class C family)